MRENAQTSAFSIRMVIRQNQWYDRDSIFAFDSVWIAYSLMFSESTGCNFCSLLLSSYPCTLHSWCPIRQCPWRHSRYDREI